MALRNQMQYVLVAAPAELSDVFPPTAERLDVVEAVEEERHANVLLVEESAGLGVACPLEGPRSQPPFSAFSACAASLDERVVVGVLGVDVPERGLDARVHAVNPHVHGEELAVDVELVLFENRVRLADELAHGGALLANVREGGHDLEAHGDLLVLDLRDELRDLGVNLRDLGVTLLELLAELWAQLGDQVLRVGRMTNSSVVERICAAAFASSDCTRASCPVCES